MLRTVYDMIGREVEVATSSIRVKEKTKPGGQVKTRLEIF